MHWRYCLMSKVLTNSSAETSQTNGKLSAETPQTNDKFSVEILQTNGKLSAGSPQTNGNLSVGDAGLARRQKVVLATRL